MILDLNLLLEIVGFLETAARARTACLLKREGRDEECKVHCRVQSISLAFSNLRFP
jgi:hypothetical protein